MKLSIFEKPPLPEDTKVPFTWGDVVTFGENQIKEIVTLPDNTLGEAKTVDFHTARAGKVSWPATRAWKDLRFQANVSSLTPDVASLLFHYREGYCINVFTYNTRLKLFCEDNELFFNYLRGDSSLRGQISTDLGGQELLKRFWSRSLTQWRVFIHRKFNWNHWEMIGPTVWKMKATRVFDRMRKEAESVRPRRIRHGVYRNEGEINAVLLYHGLDLMAEFTTLVGQGFTEELNSTHQLKLSTLGDGC